jgi:hypothetical protein
MIMAQISALLSLIFLNGSDDNLVVCRPLKIELILRVMLFRKLLLVSCVIELMM